MPSRRRLNASRYEPKSSEQIRQIACDLRQSLRTENQRAPDLWVLLRKLPTVYPHFKCKAVRDSDLPNIEAKAYGKACVLKIRESFLTALKYYGDGRARFTVAHEIGHIALGHPGNQPRAKADPEREVATEPLLEKEANQFAAEFLIPTDLVNPSMSADEISRRFQVSIDAAAHRKRQLENDASKRQQKTVPLVRRDQRSDSKTSHPRTEARNIQVFVSMAFTDAMNRLYVEICKPTIESVGLAWIRADEISSVLPISSLIGHSGSSAFRPTTTTAVSMSLTGSCFSSESAPGPSIMGVEDEAEQSTERPCCNERQVQAIGRTHLIHRPARDIIPPQGGARVSSYRM